MIFIVIFFLQKAIGRNFLINFFFWVLTLVFFYIILVLTLVKFFIKIINQYISLFLFNFILVLTLVFFNIILVLTLVNIFMKIINLFISLESFFFGVLTLVNYKLFFGFKSDNIEYRISLFKDVFIT